MGRCFFQSYENADGAAFAVEGSDEIANVAGFDAALDRNGHMRFFAECFLQNLSFYRSNLLPSVKIIVFGLKLNLILSVEMSRNFTSAFSN